MEQEAQIAKQKEELRELDKSLQGIHLPVLPSPTIGLTEARYLTKERKDICGRAETQIG